MRPNSRSVASSEMCIYIILLIYFNTNSVLGFHRSLLDYFPILAEEDAYLNIKQLAEKYKYPFEKHEVVTADGYILQLHRIPHGKYRKEKGDAIFLMHGISDSSDCWLLQGPNKALAYILADAGYDVWMGNARGNKHSNQHVSLNVNNSEYWMFSWEEIGYYDVSAMIDYTLNTTGQKKVTYIGYSQGTTTFFTLASMRPEYNNKVRLMFALAPEAFMSHARSPILRLLSPAHFYLENLLSYFNIYSSSEDLFTIITPFACKILNLGCDNFFYSILGPNNVSESMWPIILGHSPSGASTFQYIHYGQLAQSGRFRRYDYGSEQNIKIYGQENPPDYDLNKITTPIIIFYGGNDWFADPQDVKYLIKKLPKVLRTYFTVDFGHSDFIYADDNKDLVYETILKNLKKTDTNTIAPKKITSPNSLERIYVYLPQ